jgi:uncharacterized protein (TIGR00251 family)
VVTGTRDGAALRLRVIPRAGRSQVAGVRDQALLLRIAAAPVDGAANAAVIDLLATVLDISKRSISIVSGERAREKRVLVAGVDAGVVRQRLAAVIA